MQTLITIGVVIYIIFSIRKALSFGKNGGKKPAPGSWQEKLQDMARQVKEEMEKANRQAAGLPPVPPPLPGGVGNNMPGPPDLNWDDLEDSSVPVILEETVDEESQDLELQPQGAAWSQETEAPPWMTDKPEPLKPMVNTLQKKPVCTRYGKKRMRRAVIWSEILAKPLSLRE